MNLRTYSGPTLESLRRKVNEDELRACAVDPPNGAAAHYNFDIDSECYAKLYEKWRGRARPWTPKQPSRGLGDTIARITSAVGITPCAPCKERQAALNKLIPYPKNR